MKNILVTGGSGTIGTAIVKLLLSFGHNVWIVDKNEPVYDCEARFIKCDVTQYEKLKKKLAESFSTKEITDIITIAGGGLTNEWLPFEETEIETIRESIDINLLGHIYTLHAALPYMDKNDIDKSFTMISSINGKAAYSMAGYSSAKAGLEGFMYGIAKEMGKRGVRVNIVSPGTVVTELTLKEEKKDWEKLKKETLTGNFATVQDIATLVAMVIGNKSIVGQNIVIDSGQLIKK